MKNWEGEICLPALLIDLGTRARMRARADGPGSEGALRREVTAGLL